MPSLRLAAKSAFHLLPASMQAFMDFWLRGGQLLSQSAGPFNGQLVRTELVRNIIQSISMVRIVETGTFRGTSTGFLAENFCGPVLSVESNERNHYFARQFLRSYKHVRLYRGSSVDYLRKALPCWRNETEPTMFYLDAHWGGYLPLRDELRLIFEHIQCFVILIDDFRVPDDDGYRFDNYGHGKVLELAYLRPLSKFDFVVFFPAVPSVRETGQRRGCVVLARGDQVIDKLSTWDSLRRDESLWSASQ